MSEEETKKILNQVLREVAERVGICVFDQFDLRAKRSTKQYFAERNKESWTLYINRKGSLCHAVHKKGTMMVLESPEAYHDCFQVEHAINYFVNHVREITSGWR